MPIEQTEKTFKDIQAEYDRFFATEPIRDEDRAYRWHARTLLKQKPDAQKILDVACGGGFFLREVHGISRGAVGCTGIDISSRALEIARKEYPSGKYAVAVAEALPFQKESFDAITCLGSLEHFLNVGQAVGEMKRIARKSGIFYILVPNLFWYKDLLSVLLSGHRKTRNQTHERFASLGEWKELLEDLGLRVLKTIKYNGIAKSPVKQFFKNLLIPTRFSYHFLFVCRQK